MRADVTACRDALQACQEQQYAGREKRRQAVLDSVRAAAASVFPRYPAGRRAYLLVYRKAQALQRVYQDDMGFFMAFLDDLLRVANE